MDWEVAYLAGFFDGEGCISMERFVRPNRGYVEFRIRCITVQKFDDRPLEMMLRRYGGRLTERSNNSWHHVIDGQRCIDMLEDMFPYLLVKQEQARIAITFPELDKEERELALIKIRDLKKTKFLGA